MKAWTGTLKAGDTLVVRGRSPIHLVAFSLADIHERLDDARSRGNANKLYLSAGDYLLSKSNVRMLRIAADGFAPHTHDLATGPCLGCRAPLEQGLAGFGIRAHDVPSAFNLFKPVRFEGPRGTLVEKPVMLEGDAVVELVAEMPLLVGAYACGGAAASFEARPA
jgi:uncharacterized protein YcgI (DUF1989 family)